MTHCAECVPPDEVGARGMCCCCGPNNHDWQTGIGSLPDVCMACGATRPHGEGMEMTVETYEDTDEVSEQ